MQLHFSILALILAFILSAQAANSYEKPVIAAGVPKRFGEKADYENIFQQLEQAGINVFMPFSLYREIPDPQSLAYELDFFTKTENTPRALACAKKHSIKLLLPASLFDTNALDSGVDPLIDAINRIGRDMIFAVYSYDEPALQNISIEKCKELYNRVKKADPSIPVLMVQASIPESCDSKLKVDNYLLQVEKSSRFADIVGFDVYAIPEDLMKVQTPYSKIGEYKRSDLAIADYCKWLKNKFADKKHLIVLQAFCQEDQGHNPILAKVYGDRRPSLSELTAQLQVLSQYNMIPCWWGQSMLKDDSGMHFWQDLLKASRVYAGIKTSKP